MLNNESNKTVHPIARHKAQGGSRGIVLFLYVQRLMRAYGQRHTSTALPRGMTRYPLYKRLVEPQRRPEQFRKSRLTRIRSADRQAHNESLYALHYPGQYRTCSEKLYELCLGFVGFATLAEISGFVQLCQ